MKEINEKDLEQAAGGLSYRDGTTEHESTYRCDKFEMKSDARIPINCCESCVHGKRKLADKITFTCEFRVD